MATTTSCSSVCRDAERAVRAFEAAGLRAPAVVGTCTSDPSELLLRDGPLPDCGWEHPWLLPETVTYEDRVPERAGPAPHACHPTLAPIDRDLLRLFRPPSVGGGAW